MSWTSSQIRGGIYFGSSIIVAITMWGIGAYLMYSVDWRIFAGAWLFIGGNSCFKTIIGWIEK